MHPIQHSCKWIGLFQISEDIAASYFELGTLCAFVNAIAIAKDREDFLKRVFEHFQMMGFTVMSYSDDDIEELDHRVAKAEVDLDLLRGSESLSAAIPVYLGTFFTCRE